MPVPHTGHLPRSAGRPFFIVTCSGFLISRFCLHFTQYPSSAIVPSSWVVARSECVQSYLD
jgi:hypothetical protein